MPAPTQRPARSSQPPDRRWGRRPTGARFLTQADFAEYVRIRRKLTISLLAAVSVSLVGVIGYLIIGGEEHGLVDAIYMTVLSLSTVGFTEVIDMESNPVGRMFTSVLIFGGMGIAAYTVTLMAALVIEGQLRRTFARRRMEKVIDRMREHYVICGDSLASTHVIEELRLTGRNAVFVAPTEAALEGLRQHLEGTPAFVGDPTDDEVLHNARADQAAGIVFCLENDKDNLLGVFTARRLAPGARIIAAAKDQDASAKLVAAGADSVVYAVRIGGLRMASELVRPTVVTFLDQMLRVKGGTLRVEEIEVPPGATRDEGIPLTLGDFAIGDLPGALLIAIRPAGATNFAFHPQPATPVPPGTVLIVMVDAAGRTRVEQRVLSFAGRTGSSEPAEPHAVG
jgi:voltage-gated potassium channel